MGCGCRVRRNGAKPEESYSHMYASGVDTHVLQWIMPDGHDYEVTLSPMTGMVTFWASGRGVARGHLQRGTVTLGGRVTATHRAMFERMWPRLLDHMIEAGGGRTRRNPVPENHGAELDEGTQAEIDEAFRTLPVTVYGAKRRR